MSEKRLFAFHLITSGMSHVEERSRHGSEREPPTNEPLAGNKTNKAALPKANAAANAAFI